MDKEQIKAAADKVKGAGEEAVGKMTGDTKLRIEGQFDKAKGVAHEAVGNVKEAARQAEQQADRR
jgi:uncharacterized protein YjbJ (UPF0337 family)